jgi:hypothetical protein
MEMIVIILARFRLVIKPPLAACLGALKASSAPG